MAKHNVSYKIFGGYAEHITDAVLDKFGGSYANRQEFRNTWRVKFPYNVECVEFIMQETRTFFTDFAR